VPQARHIAMIIMAVIATALIGYGIWQSIPRPTPAHIMILDAHIEQTSGDDVLHYVVSGHVINDGESVSNVVQLQLVTRNNQTRNVLYQTIFSPVPAILTSKEEGTFSEAFNTQDMGGFKGTFTYAIKLLSS
jgi:hypothetical protein